MGLEFRKEDEDEEIFSESSISSSEDDENSDDLEISDRENNDVDEEARGSSTFKNPLFEGTTSNNVSSSSMSDDSADEDSESEFEKSEDLCQDDELIQALKKNKEDPQRTAPPDIHLKCDTLDLSFHPERNLLAVSTIEGDISLFEYSNEKNELFKKFQIHKKSVRSLEFNDNGSCLYTASKDKSFKIIDLETFQVKHKVSNAHPDSSLYKIKPIDEYHCATGDEDGTVKLWDYRTNKCVMEEKRFDEFVSDIYVDEEKRIMVASSGEGTIQSFNIRGKRTDIQSEVYEGEINSLTTVRSGTKLVSACGDGKLYMFKFGHFGYHDDKFPGHPDAINHVLAVTDNVVITACEDGAIRAVHLYPHRFLGVVGNHEKSFPVEHLDVSSDGEVIASISHDQKVKFWNIQYLEEIDYNKTKKPYKHPGKIKVKRKEAKMQAAREVENQLPSSNRSNRADFFKDL